ncbi:MAG: hypothetical protein WKF59_11160 [Chitinophagaceae bacterium]
MPYQFISQKHYLFDLIYNPEKTSFLQKGEQMGAIIQNGYEMLVLQAEESWKIWNAELRENIFKRFGNCNQLSLRRSHNKQLLF